METQDIAAAINRARGKKKKAVVIGEFPLRVAQEPIVISKSGDLSFTRSPDAAPGTATLLLWDPTINAFRAVLTPAGSSWELVEKQQGPQLWKPGMPT